MGNRHCSARTGKIGTHGGRAIQRVSIGRRDVRDREKSENSIASPWNEI
jgi:hypothetical protein